MKILDIISRLRKWHLVLILGLLNLFLISGAYLYYSSEKERIKRDKIDDLETISHLKINQIIQWNKERFSEAEYFANNDNFLNNVKEILRKKNDSEAQDYFTKRLLHFTKRNVYENIFITSANGEILFSVDNTLKHPDSITVKFIKDVLHQKKILFTDLYYCHIHKKIHYNIISPVVDEKRNLIALLIFSVNPNDYLYPVIQNWPVQTRTAETLIIRREGEEVQFLNKLRHNENVTLSFSIPTARKDVLSVKGVMGTTGIVEGKDYGNNEVMGHIQKVPGTPWMMISKIDTDEVYEELNYLKILLGVLTIVTILLIGSGVTLIYEYSRSSLYKKMYLKEKDFNRTREELRTTLYSIGDGVITTNINGQVARMNLVAEDLTGWKEKAAQGKHLREIFNIIDEKTDNKIECPIEKTLQHGISKSLTNNTLLVSNNDRRIPISYSSSPIKNEDKKIIGSVLVFKDETKEYTSKNLLRASEKRFSTIFHHSPVSITFSKIDGTVLEVNENFLNGTGFTQDEVIGKTSVEFGFWKNPEDRQRFLNFLMLNGNVPKMEIDFRMKSGEIRTCFISAELVNLGDEKLILSSILDITDRKLIEIALQKSQSQLTTALELAHLGHWEYDVEYDLFTFNDQFYKMLRTSAEQEGGYTMSSYEYAHKFVHPDDLSVVGNEIKKAIETEDPNYCAELEHRIKYADGEEGVITVRFHIIKDKDNRTIKTFGVDQDVTDRIKAEEAIRASEKKFSTAFHTSPDAININRLSDGLYVEVNEGFCKITGFTPKEVIGKTSLELKIWNDPEDRKAMVQKLWEEGEVNNFEAQFRKKNGTFITGLMSARVIQLNDTDCILTITRDITERKKAEQALTLFRALIDQSNDAIEILDPETFRYLDINAKACQNLGYSKDEMLSMSFTDIDPLLKEGKLENFHREFKNNGSTIFESIHKRKDGSTFPVEINLKHIHLDRSYMFAIARDISERKQAEEKIRQLSRAVEQSPASIVITDVQGNIEYVNPKFSEATGYSFDEVIGKNPRILSSGDKTHEEYKSMWVTILNKKEWRGEFQNKKKSGELYVELASISPILNEKGEITNFIAIKEDITEQKIMEELLSSERLILRTLIDNLPDAIFIKDIHSRKTLANLADVSLMGAKSESEVIGKTDFDFYQKEVAEKFYADDREILRTGVPEIKKERSFTDKDGKTQWLLTSKLPLWDGKNQITGLIGISREITQQKLNELELIQAKEKAEEMNRIKSYFYANISHELRTPFVGIMGYAELLKDTLADPEEKEMAEVILNSSLRLTDTLNKILNITKLEFDKAEINLKSVDVCAIIKNLQTLYSKSAAQQKTKIITTFHSKQSVIKTDEILLQEILSNLINNAIKYTTNGIIEILTEAVKRDNKYVFVIKVKDTGIGIPKEKQDLIWIEFRQASEGLSRSFEGTGLGLSIAKRYTNLLDGKIYVESEPGVGSTFTIELPITGLSFDEVRPETGSTPVISVQSLEPVADKLKILYVEDDATSKSFVKKVLSTNYEVLESSSGEDAIEKICMNDFFALLIDINLGSGIDGLELTKKIRQYPKFKNTPIIAVTAYASANDKEEFLSRGFSHYISKPFSSGDLLGLLKNVLADTV